MDVEFIKIRISWNNHPAWRHTSSTDKNTSSFHYATKDRTAKTSMQHEKILILLKSVFFNKGKQACLKKKKKTWTGLEM